MTNDNLLWKKKKKEKEKKKRQVLSQVQSSLLFLTYRNTAGSDHSTIPADLMGYEHCLVTK